ncbi:MAG TPA: peptidoglycan-binding protein [Solirubrobacteraceae bacterium]|nr:peptidoglycan-binding protein [Solirubrobacteraceae bacterium]
MGHRLGLRACAAGFAMAAAMATTPAAADAAFGDRVLRQGDNGREVRVLQRWLTLTGFTTSVDGNFGRRTRVAVRRYERANGLRVNGWVSREQAKGLRARAHAVRAAGGGSAPAAAAAVPQHGGTAPAPLVTPTPNAAIAPDGLTAMVPAGAPQQVHDAIVAANRIVGKPYRWGGGHARVEDDGYDCSGTVSYALMGGGLLGGPMDSTGLKRFGDAGPGTWITVYANADHTYAVIAGLRLDTSGTGGKGPRWHAGGRSRTGFVARHPAGL